MTGTSKPPKAKAVHSSQNIEETLSVKAPENTNTLLQQLMGTMQSFMEENKREKSTCKYLAFLAEIVVDNIRPRA